MSALYKQKRSPYWWWSERYEGRRFAKSTKMTNKSLAKKLQQQWDFNIMTGDFSFIGLNSDSGYYLEKYKDCLLYTSPSPRDATLSRMPSSA